MKTHEGYLPYSSGEEFQLGDFGYFKGSVWCRMGNIKDEILCEPQTEIRKAAGLDSYLMSGVSIGGGGKIGVDIANQQAASSIEFNSENSFFQKANIESHLIYSSIPEIETILKDLWKAGKWKPKYHLIVNVVKAKSFLTLISSSKKAEVNLNVDLNDERLLADNLKMGVDLGLQYNPEKVLVVNKKDEGNTYACAARFVYLKKTSFFSRSYQAEYAQNAEKLNINDRMEQGVSLAFSEEVEEEVGV